jgi:hypothetical protein
VTLNVTFREPSQPQLQRMAAEEEAPREHESVVFFGLLARQHSRPDKAHAKTGTTEGVGATAGVICVAPAGGDNYCRGKNWTTQELLSLIDSFVKLRGEHRSWRGCGRRRIPRRNQSRAAVC